MANAASSPWIVDTTETRFHVDVIERSRELPVVVDFWAPWCGPCRVLGPVLEDLAREGAGKFVLVKANADEVREPARLLGVQGIPAVFGFVEEEAVDSFVGALPAEAVSRWLEGLVELASVRRLRAQETSNPALAEAGYLQALELHPEQGDLLSGLGRVLLARGNVDGARGVLDRLESRGFMEPEAEALRAALNLQGAADLDLSALRAKYRDAGEEPSQGLVLARALAARTAHEEALELCLELIGRATGEIRDAARQLMVDVFRTLPADSDLVRTYRKRLSSALY